MIRIYQALDLPQAQLILDLLERNGIRARVGNANAQSAMGEVPFTHTYPEIWMEDEADQVLARRLIGGFERPVPTKQWRCSQCREFSPDSFELCWCCNTPRNEYGTA